MPDRVRYLLITVGAVVISFSPISVKMVPWAPTTSAFYRTLYAGLCVFVLALILREHEHPFKNVRWLLPITIGGVFLGIDFILWHKVILSLGVGPATFLGNAQVLFVAFFAVIFFKEKVHPLFPVILLITFLGLYFLTPHLAITAERNAGYVMGLFVGLSYAVMLICFRYAQAMSGADYPEILSLSLVFLVSAVTVGAYGWGFEKVHMIPQDIRGHGIMFLTALFAQTLGWYLIKPNITRVPAHAGSLLLLIQPVFATLWGVVFFHEPFQGLQILGALLALSGIAAYQLLNKNT